MLRSTSGLEALQFFSSPTKAPSIGRARGTAALGTECEAAGIGPVRVVHVAVRFVAPIGTHGRDLTKYMKMI